VAIGGITVQADIRVSVKNLEENVPGAMSAPATRLRLEWEAATRPRLFPLMKAELFIYPLTATETQLDFSGLYKPLFGALGTVGTDLHRVVARPRIYELIVPAAVHCDRARCVLVRVQPVDGCVRHHRARRVRHSSEDDAKRRLCDDGRRKEHQADAKECADAAGLR
jgi:hypothetical protein